MDRVCIFIDGSNFYHALKEAGLPVNVDLGKLGTKLKRCRSQQRFFNALRFIPNLTFKRGWLRRLPDGGQVEKGVDVMLAIDMLTLAFKDRYDVAVLVSSDADYKHAIEAVKFETGKTVELR